ncbi:MAG: hypothetical protein H6582_01140 [Crocinitomicaceae bacterium]|nr:hypothetical protein [Crocinitomicaceae bacterium]
MVKNLYRISSLILLTAFLFSCKKESTITIQAEDYITGDGSGYANMNFEVIEKYTPFFEEKSKVVYSGQLDQNGQASFNLKMKNNRKYVLGIEDPPNLCYGEVQQYYLDHASNNNVNFKYLKCGYLNLPRVNSNCEGPTEQFRLRYYYSQDQNIFYYTGYVDANFDWDPNKYLEGCIDYSNHNVYYPVPEGQYSLEWQVVRQSGTVYGSQTIEVIKSDTTNHLISY